MKPTHDTYTQLDKAYRHFNKTLFANRLPLCVITLHRKKGAYGYFWGDTWSERNGKHLTDEIALNPETFQNRSTTDVLSTLIHEMCHLEQHHFGKPSRNGYHNQEWSQMMVAVGLIPTDTGEMGGKQTGQKMTHYIAEGGGFEHSCKGLLSKGFSIPWQAITGDEETTRKKAASKTKYTCAGCSLLFKQNYPSICEKPGGTVQPDAAEVDFNSDDLPPVVSLPARHRMPYPSLGSRFSGRVKPLLDIHKLLLHSDGTTVVEGIGAVVGTGGLGKTQLAIEYVHRFGVHYVGGVFWVNADQPFANVIQELAQYAAIEIDDRLAEPQQVEMLWRGLNQFHGVILVIYDNFPEDIAFQPWLPVNTTKIKTLVTTRRQDLAHPKVMLDFMGVDESLQLLNSRDRQFNEEEALPLIEALGGLPLALELVCNFLNQRRTLSVEQLLQEMDSIGDMSALDLFAKKYSDELPSEHEKAVAATIQISWQQASPYAQAVLGVMSYWAPVPVPRRLLRRALNSEGDNSLTDPFDEALDELVKLSLIEIDEDHDPYYHRLLRGFVRVSTDQKDHQNVAVSAVTQELQRVTDARDTDAINELEKVLPHGQSVLDEELGEVDQLIDLAGYCGWHQENRGRYRLAEGNRTWALAAAEDHYEPGHPEIAISQSNLALVLKDLGDYEAARDLLTKALAAAEDHYEPGHPTIAISQSNLALVPKDLGDYEAARDLLTKALAAAEDHYEPGHPEIAIRQSNLALVLKDLGDYEAARDLLTKALAAEEQHYEPGHPTIGISQSNLAMVLQDLGDYEAARDLLTKALAAAEDHYEPRHPHISLYRANLEGIPK